MRAPLAVALAVAGVAGCGGNSIDVATIERDVDDSLTHELVMNVNSELDVTDVKCVKKSDHEASCIARTYDGEHEDQVSVAVDIGDDGRLIWRLQ